MPLAVLAPLMCGGGVGSDSRGLSLSRRGSLCRPLSVSPHRSKGYRQPLTRELQEMGPLQAARVEAEVQGDLLLYCLIIKPITSALYCFCSDPSPACSYG